jgi:tetratricopeptide (TPR) repeat protein
LQQLGHLDEARQVLAQAYQAAPKHVLLAEQYAQVLSAQEAWKEALQPLELVVNARRDNPEMLLSYARALLAVGAESEKILSTVDAVLERYPENSEALALKAEALAAGDRLQEAMEAYQEALGTGLASKEVWYKRLTTGLGKVALRLGDTDLAINSLKQVAEMAPQDVLIARHLSEAYRKKGLTKDALQQARAARSLAPSDVENLVWFARQACDLGDTKAGIEALSRAVALAPDSSELCIALGEAQLAVDPVAARSCFRQVLDLDNLPAGTRLRAAKGLLDAGDPSAAITCLQKGVEAGPPDEQLPEFLTLLAQAHLQNGDPQKALTIVDEALSKESDQSDLIQQKVDILLVTGQTEAARTCLERALERQPESRELFQRLMEILRQQGELRRALELAECRAMDHPNELSVRRLAAELALAIFETDRAKRWLQVESLPEAEDDNWLALLCLQADQALAEGAEVAAAETLTRAQKSAPQHPWVQALQARLTFRRGDRQEAVRLLQQAMEAGPPQDDSYSATLFSLAMAALEFDQFDRGIALLEGYVRHAPLEPRSHLELARAYVLRAEAQRFFQEVDAHRHAPGPGALKESAYRRFEAALLQAARLSGAGAIMEETPKAMAPDGQGAFHPVDRWYARGLAAFRPTSENAQGLAGLGQHPQDMAAYLAALRRCGELEAAQDLARVIANRELDKTKLPAELLAQAALALVGMEAQLALAAVKKAIEQRIPASPVLYALCAQVAHRAGDWDTARTAIEAALHIWGDESQWHALAAQLILEGQPRANSVEVQSAIEHLQKALRLEPSEVAHHLALGEAYLRVGGVEQAIEVLASAQEIEPQREEVLLALARAYQQRGDLKQAIEWAEKALSLAGDSPQALQLRAEIALQANEPQKALRYIKRAMTRPQPVTHVLLAKALTALEKPAQALEALEKAYHPKNAPLDVAMERADLLGRVHGLPAKLEALRELAENQPRNPGVLLSLAEAQAEAGMRKQAIETAQSGLRLAEEKLHPAEQASFHVLLGRLLREVNQLDLALHHLNLAIQMDSDQVAGYLELARTYEERRQPDRAMEVYQQALALSPKDHELYFRAGLLLKEMKDYAGAEEMLRWAMELDPNNLTYRRQWGAIAAMNLIHAPREAVL